MKTEKATKTAKPKNEKSVHVGRAQPVPVRARGNPSPPGHAKRDEAKAKEPVGRSTPPPTPKPKLAPQFPPVPPLPLPELPLDDKTKKSK